MSKKKVKKVVEEVQEQPIITEEETTAVVEPEPEIQAVCTQYVEEPLTFEQAMEKLTIRQLSLVTGAGYNSLLKASKQPVEGQIYDPDAVNYDAMIKVVARKIGDEAMKDISWNEIVRKGTELEGAIAPVELDVAVDDFVTLRPVVDADGTVTAFPNYKVRIVTPTHIVFMAEDSTQPRVMSNVTFKHSGGKKVTADA